MTVICCRVHGASRVFVDGGSSSANCRSSQPGEASSQAPGPESPLAEWFPGRWSPRRQIPSEIAPLPLVCAEALERAGWWRRACGESVAGGLVVSIEGVSLPAHLGFARDLADDPAVIAPSGFLFALPSTCASVLGLLFGLPDYQATVTEGARGGERAFQHGVELLALDRVSRVLIAGIRVGQEMLAPGARALENPSPRVVRAAAAVCMERMGAGTRATADGQDGALEIEMSGDLAADTGPKSEVESLGDLVDRLTAASRGSRPDRIRITRRGVEHHE